MVHSQSHLKAQSVSIVDGRGHGDVFAFIQTNRTGRSERSIFVVFNPIKPIRFPCVWRPDGRGDGSDA